MANELTQKEMLAAMSPILTAEEYVFCTLENANYGDYADARPIASFSEPEGLSLVLLKESAGTCGLTYDGSFRCITLTIHSSLQAVGLTSAVSGLLAEHGISANMIAAYFHDHVFVPSEHAERALELLLAQSEQNQ